MMRASALIGVLAVLSYGVQAQSPISPVSIVPAKAVVTHAPRPEYSASARARHLKGNGVFMLHLRPDGTVSSVDTLKSTGHSELDQSSIAAFSRWRFEPGFARSSRGVKIPIAFTIKGAQL
jgi:TonB family protein